MGKMPKALIVVSVLSVTGLWAPTARAQTNLVDLGATTGHAINNKGQVALDAGVYSNGGVTPLPALPGDSTPAVALAINASAQVAGSACCTTAILYSGGTLTNIGANFFDGINRTYSWATGINTSGLVVGYYDANNMDNIEASFTYTNGTVTNLDSPCQTFNPHCILSHGPRAFGINDSGQIVGGLYYDQSLNTTTYCMQSTDAFIYDNGTWTDLGAGTGYAINARGQVTGTLTSIDTRPGCFTLGTSAFLYTGGVVNKLGTLAGGANSIGYALNSTGQVVGASDFTGSTATHAFFYNGVMTDLNSMVSPTDPLQPYVTLTDARGINDSRLIVVNGVDSRTNLMHAYLLQGPWINIAPGPLSFGNITVGSTSAMQTVTLTNAGPNPLSLSDISATSNFLATSACGASLAPAAQCTVTVSFAPTTAGTLSGGLTIVAGGVTQVVGLSGVGLINSSLTASAAALSVGQSLTLTWTSSAGSTCVAGSDTGTFQGPIPASGSKVLTEAAPGTDAYGIDCSAPGAPDVTPNTQVVWSWPAVTTTISAAPTTLRVGGSTTLTWSSANATSCSASGGGGGDNWPGTKAASGTQSVTENYALAGASTTLTYTISCSSKASGLSSQTSVQVTETYGVTENNNLTTAGHGGGGTFDWVSLLALLGMLQACVRARRTHRETH